jgi:hypothetical protein
MRGEGKKYRGRSNYGRGTRKNVMIKVKAMLEGWRQGGKRWRGLWKEVAWYCERQRKVGEGVVEVRGEGRGLIRQRGGEKEGETGNERREGHLVSEIEEGGDGKGAEERRRRKERSTVSMED